MDEWKKKNDYDRDEWMIKKKKEYEKAMRMDNCKSPQVSSVCLQNFVCYTRMSGRPSLKLRLNDCSYDALLDTGASINVIEKSLLSQKDLKDVQKDTISATCANGDTLKINGKLKILIQIGKLKKEVEFYVVEKVKPKIVAGMPFLNLFGFELVTKENVSNIDADQHKDEKLKSLLNKFDSIFMKNKWDVGKTNLLKHEIITNGSPIQINPRRQPVHLQQQIQEDISQLLKNGIIKECESAWNSPIVCVKKKDQKEIRICLDFRQLNEITERPIFPIPNVDEILDHIGNAKYFSTLDLGNAYYQIELEEASKEKTAFSTRNRQYCFNRMPFGIAAAPATFQRMMNKMLEDLNWKIALVYLDDIIIFSKSKEEHYHNLQLVFEKIKQHGLKVKLKKCHFLKESVKFLGHILTKDGLSTDPDKLKAIQEMPTPKCIKQLRSFLGLCNYYRRFFHNYSKYSNPLEKLCSSTNKKLEWNEECARNFEELKKKLIESPILAYPDFNKTFILDTDASYDCIGAVLSQKDENGKERVISYGSHSMNKHELGYCVTRKELLAIYYFVNHFKHYLYGKKFRVRTDHKAITFMTKTKKPITAQFQTWISFLSSLDIEFVYRKGEKHANADALSRKNCTTCSQCQTIHPGSTTTKLKTKLLSIMRESSNKWQENNMEIENIRKEIAEGNTNFFEDQGVIRTKDDKIWIPDDRRNDFITEYHQKLCHAGQLKTTKYIKDEFEMKKMDEKVKEVIEKCEPCQKRKTYTGRTKETHIKRKEVEDFEVIFIDFCGPMKTTKNGRRYIMAIVDSSSKFVVLKAVNQQDEKTTVNILKNEWILKYGAPRIIHTDRGRTFEGAMIADLAKKCNIKMEFSSPYHHSSNGQIERQFRTIRDALSTKMQDGNANDWSELIPEVEFMINATYQKEIKMSPAERVFGRKLKRENFRPHIEDFETNDLKNIRKFNVGDRVLIRKANAEKQENRYEGPGKIIEKIHERSFKIEMENGARYIRNVEWLKPFK